MPRTPIPKPAGQNGSLEPLAFLQQQVHRVFAQVQTHWQAFADTDLRRVLPLQALLRDGSGALAGTERIHAPWFRLVALAATSEALRLTDDHPRADEALSAARALLRDRLGDIHAGYHYTCYAAIAFAEERAANHAEADRLLSRALSMGGDERHESLLGLTRLSLLRGDHAAIVDHILARLPPDTSVWSSRSVYADQLIGALVAEAPHELDRLLAGLDDPSHRLALIQLAVPHFLARGDAAGALARCALPGRYMSDLIADSMYHAIANRAPALPRMADAIERTLIPHHICFMPRWRAVVDPGAARAQLGALSAELTAPWKREALAVAALVLGDQEGAFAVLDAIPDSSRAQRALRDAGDLCIVRGDTAGLARVLASLGAHHDNAGPQEKPQYTAQIARLQLRAGDHAAGRAAFAAALKEAAAVKPGAYRYERIWAIDKVLEAQLEAGYLAGAVKTSKKIRNRDSRDAALRRIATAYGRAGDLAGAALALEGFRDPRHRGHAAAAAAEAWAVSAGRYPCPLVFVW